MRSDLWRAAPLALLLAAPPVPAARAEEKPQVEKRIVIEDDDEPIVVRSPRSSSRGYLGVQLVEITPELRAHYGANRNAGVLVGSVEPDSPAAKAGIEVGDVIVKADGESVESVNDLTGRIRDKKAGDTVKIEISRNRAAKTVTATIAERTARHGHTISIPDLAEVHPLFGHSSDHSLRDRLDAIEKRLDSLEKKSTAR